MKLVYITFLFLVINNSFSQVVPEKTNFRSPLGIDLILAGNFAEVRSNHFHTGIDIKTNGKEGYKVYAIDSGYISRINISHYGYGNAVYIKHPNGYTSVYAHLSTFPKEVLDYIRKKQYSEKSETIQVYPGPSDLKVAKGDVFAYSGNSGSSSAPHLHFEIRDTKNENPLNPLLFGFDIKDDRKPAIFDVKIYPLEGGVINGNKEAYNMDMSGSDGDYKRAYDVPVKVKGKVGFAINTIDYLNGAGNQCGIYTIELFVDNELKFKQKLDRLDFADNRYINTHCDYLEYRLKKQSYHKSFVSENNKLNIYESIKDRGRLEFDDTLNHQCKYIVKDVYGNTSQVNFIVKGDGKSNEVFEELTGARVLDASSSNEVKEEGFEVYMKKNSIYDDLKYDYENEKINNSLSALHHFHNDYIPVQEYFVMKIKTANIPTGNESKSIVVEMNSKERIIAARGGEYKDGWVETEVRSFGNYTVKIDSVPPKVEPINFSEGKNVSNSSNIQFKMADNLSGIKDYSMYVDGKWYLSYYDTGRGTLTLPFDEYNVISSGQHVLKVEVTDERKNVTTLTYNFTK